MFKNNKNLKPKSSSTREGRSPTREGRNIPSIPSQRGRSVPTQERGHTSIHRRRMVHPKQTSGTVLKNPEPGPATGGTIKRTPMDTKPGTSSSKDDPGPSGTGATTSRHIGPSLQAYRSRRAAYRLVSRLKEIPEKDLTEQERKSLQWANKVITEREESLKEKAQTKRPRSNEDIQPQAKKARQGPSPRQNPRPLNEAGKDQLQWAVIDRSNPDGTISPGNWKMVEVALLKVYKQVMTENPGPPPRCRDAGWYQGHVKLISCADQRSADLYKLAISKLGEVWPGSRLEAVTEDMIPNRPRSRTRIPVEPSDPQEILEIIQLSNPDLPTQNWKVVKVGETRGNSRQAIVVLNEESLAPLKNTCGEINYGFDSIFLRVYRKDSRRSNKEGGESEEPPNPNPDGGDPLMDVQDIESLSSLDGDSEVRATGELLERLQTIEDEDLLLNDGNGSEDKERKEPAGDQSGAN